MPAPASIDPRFSADAFSLTPDPGRLFLSRDHAEALAQLRLGLEQRRGLVVVVGEVGTGKTTLAYAWLTGLGPDVRTAYLGNTRLPFEGLLRHALAEYGVAARGNDRPALLAALGIFLGDCVRAGQRAVLVVDEAQSLDDETFESVAALVDVQIVFIGQPEFATKLRQPQLRAIADRVAVRIDLAPLDREESRRYIAYRLEKSGGSLALFSAEALDLVLDHAAGVPRRVNILCHNALLLAYAAGEARVSRVMVAEAIHELTGGSLKRFGTRPAVSPATRERRVRVLHQWSRGLGLGLAAGAVILVVWWRPAPVTKSLVVPTTVPVRVVTSPPPSTAPSNEAAVLPPTQIALVRPPETPVDEAPPVPAPAVVEPEPAFPVTVVSTTTPALAVVPTTVPAMVVTSPPPSTAPSNEAAVPPPTQIALVRPPETPVDEVPPVPVPAVVEPEPALPVTVVSTTTPALAVVPTTVPAMVVTSPPPSTAPSNEAAVPPPTQIALVRPPETPVDEAPPVPAPAVVEPEPALPVTVVSTTLPVAAAAPPTEPQMASLPSAAALAPPPVPAVRETSVSDAEVRALLDRYERAWRMGDVTELRRIGQIGDDRQAKALAKYLETVHDLDVQVRILEIGGDGERRTVRFTRHDRFRDPLGREVSKESPPIEKMIERTPAGLRFVPRS